MKALLYEATARTKKNHVEGKVHGTIDGLVAICGRRIESEWLIDTSESFTPWGYWRCRNCSGVLG